ncbi:MAG: hypothetical protein JSV38_02315 [Desulfobacterales bacterium]|nr:MAG: hypothetical protein JSV38_02315 [Desulfobacterales bacterium]
MMVSLFNREKEKQTGHLFFQIFLAFVVVWGKTHVAPVIIAQLAKIAILARMFFKVFILLFWNVNLTL